MKTWDSEMRDAKRLVEIALNEEASGDSRMALLILIALLFGKLDRIEGQQEAIPIQGGNR